MRLMKQQQQQALRAAAVPSQEMPAGMSTVQAASAGQPLRACPAPMCHQSLQQLCGMGSSAGCSQGRMQQMRMALQGPATARTSPVQDRSSVVARAVGLVQCWQLLRTPPHQPTKTVCPWWAAGWQRGHRTGAHLWLQGEALQQVGRLTWWDQPLPLV